MFISILSLNIYSLDLNCNPPKKGDWIITNKVICKDKVINLNGGKIIINMQLLELFSNNSNNIKNKKKKIDEITSKIISTNFKSEYLAYFSTPYDITFQNATIISELFSKGSISINAKDSFFKNTLYMQNYSLFFSESSIFLKQLTLNEGKEILISNSSFMSDVSFNDNEITHILTSDINGLLLLNSKKRMIISNSNINEIILNGNSINYIFNSRINNCRLTDNTINLFINTNISEQLKSEKNSNNYFLNSKLNSIILTDDTNIKVKESSIAKISFSGTPVIEFTNVTINTIYSIYKNDMGAIKIKGQFILKDKSFSSFIDYKIIQEVPIKVIGNLDESNLEGINVTLLTNEKTIVSKITNKDGIVLFDLDFKNKEDYYVKLTNENYSKIKRLNNTDETPIKIIFPQKELNCNPPSDIDWIINDDLICKNRQILLNSYDIKILSNSNVSFENVTLYANLYFFDNTNFLLKNSILNGNLSLKDKSIIYIQNSMINGDIELMQNTISNIKDSIINSISISGNIKLFLKNVTIKKEIIKGKYIIENS